MVHVSQSTELHSSRSKRTWTMQEEKANSNQIKQKKYDPSHLVTGRSSKESSDHQNGKRGRVHWIDVVCMDIGVAAAVSLHYMGT